MSKELRKSKLYKKDIAQHKRDLRSLCIIGFLDQIRHLKRFIRTFRDKDDE